MSQRPNILILHSDEHSFRFLSARNRERVVNPVARPHWMV